MSFDAQTSNAALRRTRSTGDIPRQPEPTYRPRGSRHSDSHSDLCDPQPSHGHRGVASSSIPRTPLSAGITSGGRWTPQNEIAAYPEQGQTQTIGGDLPPLRQEPHDDTPRPHHNMSSYERTLAFFGIGRRASRARRSLVGLFFNLTSGFVQVCNINNQHLATGLIQTIADCHYCDRSGALRDSPQESNATGIDGVGGL